MSTGAKRDKAGFNEATGADPVDASCSSVRDSGSFTGFNEATGADPVDAGPADPPSAGLPVLQ